MTGFGRLSIPLSSDPPGQIRDEWRENPPNRPDLDTFLTPAGQEDQTGQPAARNRAAIFSLASGRPALIDIRCQNQCR